MDAPQSPSKNVPAVPPASPNPFGENVNHPFPNPDLSPTDFLAYLQSIDVDDFTTTWQHLNNRPVRSPTTGLFNEVDVTGWTDRTDTLLGRLSRVKRAHPKYVDVADVIFTACNDGIDAMSTDLRLQRAKVAEEAKAKKDQEEARILEKERRREEKEELKRKWKLLEEAEVEADAFDFESASEADVVVYDPRCKACEAKDLVCQGQPGKACDICRRDHKTCTQGVIRRPRKARAVAKAVVVKQEPSPGHKGQKQKADSSIVVSDDDIESNDDSVIVNDKAMKTKVKVPTNKGQLDGVVLPPGGGPIRKSTRVNRATGNAAKKARFNAAIPTDANLWHRLANELLTVSKTLNEIGDSVGI